MPRKTPRYIKRPITIPRTVKSPDQAKFVLRLNAGILLSLSGEDEDPSPFLRRMVEHPDISPEDVEPGQDGALFGAEVLDLIADCIKDDGTFDGAKFGQELLWAGLAFVPEMKDDIDALKD